MKKIIIIIIFVLLSSIALSAKDQIPGYFEFGASFTKLDSDFLRNTKNAYLSNINFKYGILKNWYVSPYITGKHETHFIHNSFTSNSPFMEAYSFGFGITILDIFYVKFTHECRHKVISGSFISETFELYDGTYVTKTDPKYQDIVDFQEFFSGNSDNIEFGFKIEID